MTIAGVGGANADMGPLGSGGGLTAMVDTHHPPRRTRRTTLPTVSVLEVTIGADTVRLAAGEHLVFGRDPGPGQLTSTDLAVSGRHGRLDSTDDGWTVTSLGSIHSFSVYDAHTPSRLFIPVGSGPVAVPFAAALVVVDVEYRRYPLSVSAEGSPGWTTGWRSVRATGNDQDRVTQAAWNHARMSDRSGRPLRWFQVLVAMCEPRLRLPMAAREDRIPTNREIAHRLGISVTVLENHHIDRLRNELGFTAYSEQFRQAAVIMAIQQGLVTPDDLVLLEQAGRDG